MKIMDSRVESVTVYRSGARVNRIVEVSKKNGKFPTRIEVPLLPLALFDPMVRVRVHHIDGKGELVATGTRVGLYARPRDTVEAPDTTKLKNTERELLRKTRMLQQIEMEMAALSQIEVPERPEAEEGKPPPASPMAARVALEQFSDEAISKRIEERRALRDEIKELHDKVAELQDALRRASDAQRVKAHELTKNVVVELTASDDADIKQATLHLEYYIPGARWAPAYQVRLSGDCREAAVQLRAVVCQRSGEDWKGVRLLLSTAAPLRFSELPELSSIRIGRAQAPVLSKKGFRPPPKGAASLFADFDRGRDETTGLLPSSTGWSPPYLEVPYLEDNMSVAEAVMGQIERRGSRRAGGGGIGGKKQRLRDEAPAEAKLEEEPMAMLDDMEGGALDMDFEEIASAPAPVAASPVAGSRKAMKPSKRMAKEKSLARSGAGPGAADVFGGEAPTQEVMSLVYTQLRLSWATDTAQRNRLAPVDLRASYFELLQESSGGRIDNSLMDAVHAAMHRAQSVAELPLPSGASNVADSTGRFDYTYEADAVVDVPSDGSFHSIALGARDAESDVRYVVVPREDSNVYRVARLTNPTEAPLLPGPAEVYVGGEYVLTTGLPLVASRGEFRLGLGVEQGIKCARNTKFAEKRSGEKVVAMRELFHDIDIELANNLGRDVLCEVRERIPQPEENAEVVIEEVEVVPKWDDYDQVKRGKRLQGGRRWEAQIKAQKTANFRAQYVIKIYASNELVGGNRREA